MGREEEDKPSKAERAAVISIGKAYELPRIRTVVDEDSPHSPCDVFGHLREGTNMQTMQRRSPIARPMTAQIGGIISEAQQRRCYAAKYVIHRQTTAVIDGPENTAAVLKAVAEASPEVVATLDTMVTEELAEDDGESESSRPKAILLATETQSIVYVGDAEFHDRWHHNHVYEVMPIDNDEYVIGEHL